LVPQLDGGREVILIGLCDTYVASSNVGGVDAVHAAWSERSDSLNSSSSSTETLIHPWCDSSAKVGFSPMPEAQRSCEDARSIRATRREQRGN